jgi:hypothetical protein
MQLERNLRDQDGDTLPMISFKKGFVIYASPPIAIPFAISISLPMFEPQVSPPEDGSCWSLTPVKK